MWEQWLIIYGIYLCLGQFYKAQVIPKTLLYMCMLQLK